jgi:DNA-binding MarR family transcriptional regulator
MNQDSGRIPAFGRLALAAKYQNLLALGDVEGQYGGDGSKIVGAIIMHAAWRGASKGWLFEALNDTRNRGGFACLRRRRPDLGRWFEREWQKAEALVRNNPPAGNRHDVMFAIQERREYAATLPWSGRGGATDRAVYEVLLQIAQRAQRLSDFGASVREVAERAGLSRASAANSLRRLDQHWRLTRRTSAGAGQRASIWSLRPLARDGPKSRGTHRGQSGNTFGPCVIDCPGDVQADVWRWSAGGLGKAKWRVWSHLGLKIVSVSDLAAVLQLSEHTIRGHLRSLAKHGLAEHQPDGWRRGSATPDEVAIRLGVAGIGERQRERHSLERAAYRANLQSFAIEQDTPPERVDHETGEVVATKELRAPQVVELRSGRGGPRRRGPAALGIEHAAISNERSNGRTAARGRKRQVSRRLAGVRDALLESSATA